MTIVLAQQVWPAGVEQISSPLQVQGNPKGLTLRVRALLAQADLNDTTLILDMAVQPSFDQQGNVWQGDPYLGYAWGGGPGPRGLPQTECLWEWGMSSPIPRWFRFHVTPNRDVNVGLDASVVLG